MLLGLTWGIAYGLVEQIWPGSLRSQLTPDGRVAWPDFIVFSFVTLTSVGYGDVSPVGEHGKSLAILEAITGAMFVAVFVAGLVGRRGQGGGRTPPR